MTCDNIPRPPIIRPVGPPAGGAVRSRRECGPCRPLLRFRFEPAPDPFRKLDGPWRGLGTIGCRWPTSQRAFPVSAAVPRRGRKDV